MTIAARRYAVIDFETTGLDPSIDRVVESAVLLTDATGNVSEEWSTLVAIPGDDEPGASFLHGITRQSLVGAPNFAAIVGGLIAHLSSSIVVSHVLEFDLAQLGAEFERIGLALPELGPAGICTRDLARAHLDLPSRSLAACCAAIAVDFDAPHSALGDARATAGLLRYFIAAGHLKDQSDADAVLANLVWPEVAFEPDCLLARTVSVKTERV